MADIQAQIKALTVVAKEMGLSDRDALQYARECAKEIRQEAAQAEKERAQAEREAEKERAQAEREERAAQAERELTRERERETREAEERREVREREERMERDREERAHQFRIRELEIQANAHFSPSASPAHPPSETHSNASVNAGLGQFTFPPFRENVETVDVYLDRFAKLAEAYQIPRDKWNVRLSQGLSGAAYETFARLPAHEETNFECLKVALLKRYELTSSAYRQKFRTGRRSAGESVAQFVTRIRGYLLKFHQMAEYDDTVEGWTELMLVEQLRETLPKHTQTFLAEQGAERLETMVMLAERYLTAHGDPATTKHKAGSPQEQPDNQPQNDQNSKFGKSSGQGQHQRNQSNPPVPNSNNHNNHNNPHNNNSGRKLFCTNCRTNTHNTEQCRSKNPRLHAACAKVVRPTLPHENRNQPNRPPVTEMARVNSVEVETLYDTGLLYDAIVDSALVQPDQLTGQTIEILGMTKSGPSMTAPIANISVESKYVTGTISAAVLEEPLYPLILGCKYVPLAQPRAPVIAAILQTREQVKAEQVPTLKHNPHPADMSEAQTRDDSLRPCFRKLVKARNPHQTGNFYMENNLLYRRAGKGRKARRQLVVPSPYREHILQTAHNIPFTGHAGTSATVQRVAGHHYWPGMNEDINRYVKSCPECQRTTHRSPDASTTLGEIPSTSFTRVAVTDARPLRGTQGRNATF
ncbi:hypothetical protein BsWGS_07421 [Bradybaena similaris]